MQIQTCFCNTGMYCEKSHQGGSVHLWSATHSANSGALSGLIVVLAARLTAVLAARLAAVLAAGLAAVLAARLVAGLARLVAGARPHILICTAVRLAANKKIPKYTENSTPDYLQNCAYEKEPDEVAI
jgi:hypothetical protein